MDGNVSPAPPAPRGGRGSHRGHRGQRGGRGGTRGGFRGVLGGGVTLGPGGGRGAPGNQAAAAAAPVDVGAPANRGGRGNRGNHGLANGAAGRGTQNAARGGGRGRGAPGQTNRQRREAEAIARGIPPHPNGEMLIAIRDVAKVHGHYEEIPRRCYHGARSGYQSLVTTEDVQAASDQFDGEGILHDIDTQWGMIPGGGALEYCGYGSD